jgi:hypothetical protein
VIETSPAYDIETNSAASAHVLNNLFIPTSGLGHFIRDIYDPNPP